MNHIWEGNYYTLADLAAKLGVTKMAVIRRQKKLGIKPIRLGVNVTRYSEMQAKRILGLGPKSYGPYGRRQTPIIP